LCIGLTIGKMFPRHQQSKLMHIVQASNVTLRLLSACTHA
jgi:hypothetical protein